MAKSTKRTLGITSGSLSIKKHVPRELVARKSGANKDEKASAGLSEFKEFYEPL
jgi:hypothetical protein